MITGDGVNWRETINAFVVCLPLNNLCTKHQQVEAEYFILAQSCGCESAITKLGQEIVMLKDGMPKVSLPSTNIFHKISDHFLKKLKAIVNFPHRLFTVT